MKHIITFYNIDNDYPDGVIKISGDAGCNIPRVGEHVLVGEISMVIQNVQWHYPAKLEEGYNLQPISVYAKIDISDIPEFFRSSEGLQFNSQENENPENENDTCIEEDVFDMQDKFDECVSRLTKYRPELLENKKFLKVTQNVREGLIEIFCYTDDEYDY